MHRGWTYAMLYGMVLAVLRLTGAHPESIRPRWESRGNDILGQVVQQCAMLLTACNVEVWFN